MSLPHGLDPQARDAGGWGTSLIHNAEPVLACLNAAEARSVVEVGAFRGELTELLLRRADEQGGRVVAVDTVPHAELHELDEREPGLELLTETSFAVLARIPLPDAIILDGDHNYYTVSEELRIIDERVDSESGRLPLLLMHDVGWPHGRRDDYYVPSRIPDAHRHPLADEGLFPGEPGTYRGGIPCDNPAAHEGGPRNGVLTAIEDFLADRPSLRLAVIPSFYGLGVVWDPTAPYGDALSAAVAPWDRHPLLQRMEDNRVFHLASRHVVMILAQGAEEQLTARQPQLDRQRELLQSIHDSRVLRAAARVLRLRGHEPVFSPEEIERVIG